jgi:hypothetical protein
MFRLHYWGRLKLVSRRLCCQRKKRKPRRNWSCWCLSRRAFPCFEYRSDAQRHCLPARRLLGLAEVLPISQRSISGFIGTSALWPRIASCQTKKVTRSTNNTPTGQSDPSIVAATMVKSEAHGVPTSLKWPGSVSFDTMKLLAPHALQMAGDARAERLRAK